MSKLDKIITKSVSIAGKDLKLEVGRFAEQATAAVLVTSGETVVHVTVVAGLLRPDLGYFPLSVDYQEKLYAAGIIKGSRWIKRDGRPTDEAILKARLIDRSIRPLFPKEYTNEVQVVVSVLSYDQQTDPGLLGLVGTSAALSISSIPWQGPIAAVRMGLANDGQLLVNPSKDQMAESQLDLVLSGSEEAVVMVEAGAQEVSEDQAVAALQKGHEAIKTIVNTINELVSEVKPIKAEVVKSEVPAEVKKQVLDKAKKDMDDLLGRLSSGGSHDEVNTISTAVVEALPDLNLDQVTATLEEYFNDGVRDQLVVKKIRPDGRKPDEIRALSSEVGLLPRTHGSAMFKRGQTQAVTITTLGSPGLEQLIEDIDGETTKRYIHHYVFPPFSVGEAGRIGFPSRREIGHGALAERALLPMIPDKEEFPYTILVVSEIMSSNGSTSMASVCGSTLSLMDAGVPLKKPVAGIAMGLMAKLTGNTITDYTVLTDIAGLEDHIGDMDFKVAGTKDGITALQMDIKIPGVTLEILTDALSKAKVARLTILESMLATLAKPRENVSAFAPKILSLTIPVSKIGELIGPGGKNIKKIIADTECDVNVDDDGRVSISGVDAAKLQQAYDWVDSITREIKVGEEFEGKVVRIENFGAFVELLPGRDGMAHISKLSPNFVQNIHDVVKMGDTLHVRVDEVDDSGKISLTTLTSEQEEEARKNRPPRNDRRGSRPMGGRPPFRGGGGFRDRGPRR
jgi:polyribonucleotide nucleotidyltransferase